MAGVLLGVLEIEDLLKTFRRVPSFLSGMRKRFAALVVVLAASAAHADCTVSVGTLAFGTYDVFSTTPLDSVATITYSCTAPATAPTMSISRGGATSFLPRQMLNGASALNYNLYLDAARTQIWGDGSAGTSTYSCSMGSGLSVSVYGRIFAQQNLPVGSYSDSLVVTITF
jgi:spore coat protein U-like protein